MRQLGALVPLLALLCASCTAPIQPEPVSTFATTLDQYIAAHPDRQAALTAALDGPSQWINLSYKELKLVTHTRSNWEEERPQRFWGDTFYIDERRAEQCHLLDGVMFFYTYTVVIQSCNVVATIVSTPHTQRIQQFVLTSPDLSVVTARALLERRVTEGMTVGDIKLLYPSLRLRETARCDGKPTNSCTVACNVCEVSLMVNATSYYLENRGIFDVPRLKLLNPALSFAPN